MKTKIIKMNISEELKKRIIIDNTYNKINFFPENIKERIIIDNTYMKPKNKQQSIKQYNILCYYNY